MEPKGSKVARLKVVRSTGHEGQMSLRGPKGQGENDPPQHHITEAGFQDGDLVVLIPLNVYNSLLDAYAAVGWQDAGTPDDGVPF